MTYIMMFRNTLERTTSTSCKWKTPPYTLLHLRLVWLMRIRNIFEPITCDVIQMKDRLLYSIQLRQCYALKGMTPSLHFVCFCLCIQHVGTTARVDCLDATKKTSKTWAHQLHRGHKQALKSCKWEIPPYTLLDFVFFSKMWLQQLVWTLI